MSVLEKLFNPAARGSTVKREMLAGLTSFMAMCYLIFVVPGMLADAGMPKDSAVVTSAMLRTWPVKLEAIKFTWSVKSFQVPATSGT